MEINIENRLWNDFSIWAEANNMNEYDMQRYVILAFRDKFYIDKYGDLNDKLPKKENGCKPKDKPCEEQSIACNLPKIEDEIEESANEPVVEKKKPTRKTKIIKSN